MITLLLLAFATTVPALWTMQCFSSKRAISMWGEAKECNPSPCKPESASLKVLCCEFSSAQSHLSDYDKKVQDLPTSSPIVVRHVFPVAVRQTVLPPTVAALANGPPLAKSLYERVAIAQLRA